MDRIRSRRRGRQRVHIGAPDPCLTPNGGLAAVTELVDRLGVVASLDAAIGSIKQRNRGHSGRQLLVGTAAAQLAGEEFLVGSDRQRADVARQQLTPVPGLCSTTAAGLARRFTDAQWQAVERGLAGVHERMLALLPVQRRARLTGAATVDLDTTDVEVYGSKKHGVAYNYQGQRCGRPHVATWADTEITLAAELLAGDDDPRPHAADLLRRALAALPARVRAGRVKLRADAGYFAGELARAAHVEGVEFGIGAKRIAPLWRLLDGIAKHDWAEAIDMDGARVAVADYRPDWWPANTSLLIRRVRLAASQISADPRSRRRRTLHPQQRALPLDELGDADAIYGYSLSGHHQVNTAWMWGALLAATMADWLHQLTGTVAADGALAGHGVRDGKAMIATLRHRLICVPARLIRHAGQLLLRPPPGHDLLAEILARLRALPPLF